MARGHIPTPQEKSLVTLFASASMPESTRRSTIGTVSLFQRWCAANGVVASPVREDDLLRWLHADYPRIGWSTAHGRVYAVVRWQRQLGLPDPRTLRTGRYLQGLRREKGRRAAPRTDALRIQEADQIVDAALDESATSNCQTLASGAVILAHYAGIPIISATRRPKLGDNAFWFDIDRIFVSEAHIDVVPAKGEPGRKARIARDRQPVHYQVLRAALIRSRALNGHGVPNVSADEPTMLVPSGFFRTQAIPDLNLAWRRLNHVGNPRVSADVKQLTADEATWLALSVNPRLDVALRNRAYLLVGLFLARRHSDLERLQIHHLTKSGDGYSILFPTSKTDQLGQGLIKQLGHANLGESCRTGRPCHHLCPVRAIDDYLEHQRRYRQRTTGPLFATMLNGETGSINIRTAGHHLGRLWKAAGLDPDATVGTRSLRVGGATTASEQGMSVREIAEKITDHRSMETTELYIRGLDPYSHTLQLGL